MSAGRRRSLMVGPYLSEAPSRPTHTPVGDGQQIVWLPRPVSSRGSLEGRRIERCLVIKISKSKPPKPSDQDGVHQPVVGEAGPRVANPKALANSFAPGVETRAVADLKVNPRNARTHSAAAGSANRGQRA